ncbi:MAG TPA: hypothetical protein DCP90_05270 [Clostridiales bacterium]|nr:MAG: hypothetical protein A2Y22_08935 [Clostridiales bacterium GWD2_32_59]HAN10010.1 hypothetical protein [Clostridiales bacterium]
MEKKKIIIGAVIAIGLIIIIMSIIGNNSKQETINGADTKNAEEKVQIKVENPEELKIEVSEETKKIQDKVKFSSITSSVKDNITTVTGTIENLTSDVITPYMNIYFYDNNNKLVITANAFADKIQANGSKQFVANLTGDFSGLELKVELAELE